MSKKYQNNKGLTSIWILGGGNFGQKSLASLKIKHPKAVITVIEKEKNKSISLKTDHVNVIESDGICYLDRYMTKTNPDIIVPAIPVHVAYEWTRKKLTPKFNIKPTSIPDMLLDELPNPIIGPVGMAYASISDFMCPDNCPEPAEICIVTKKPRIYLLFQKLKCLNVGSFKSFVIQSEQLAPGVGGYSPKALFNLLSAIKKSSSPVLLSTACSCHGVINAFKFIRK